MGSGSLGRNYAGVPNLTNSFRVTYQLYGKKKLNRRFSIENTQDCQNNILS